MTPDPTGEVSWPSRTSGGPVPPQLFCSSLGTRGQSQGCDPTFKRGGSVTRHFQKQRRGHLSCTHLTLGFEIPWEPLWASGNTILPHSSANEKRITHPPALETDISPSAPKTGLEWTQTVSTVMDLTAWYSMSRIPPRTTDTLNTAAANCVLQPKNNRQVQSSN